MLSRYAVDSAREAARREQKAGRQMRNIACFLSGEGIITHLVVRGQGEYTATIVACMPTVVLPFLRRAVVTFHDISTC